MAQIELELSEAGVNKLLKRIQENSDFSAAPTDWKKLGRLRLRLERGVARFENGSFEVIDPALGGPRGLIKELDLVWRALDIGVGLDIPEVTVGGFCIIPTPWGCAIHAPKKTFFKADPDISATLPLAGLRHELSAAFEFGTRTTSDKWEILLKPKSPIDIDFIDLADMVGDLLNLLIRAFVDKVLGFLPDWARDLVEAILGSFADLIRRLLDLNDDVMEWIEQKIGISLGLVDIALSIFFEFFYEGKPIVEFLNPHELLPAAGGLPAVALKISDLKAGFALAPNRATFSLTLAGA